MPKRKAGLPLMVKRAPSIDKTVADSAARQPVRLSEWAIRLPKMQQRHNVGSLAAFIVLRLETCCDSDNGLWEFYANFANEREFAEFASKLPDWRGKPPTLNDVRSCAGLSHPIRLVTRVATVPACAGPSFRFPLVLFAPLCGKNPRLIQETH